MDIDSKGHTSLVYMYTCVFNASLPLCARRADPLIVARAFKVPLVYDNVCVCVCARDVDVRNDVIRTRLYYKYYIGI